MPVIPALWEAEAGGFLSSRPAGLQSEARTARAIQRNPVSKKPNPKNKQTNKKRKKRKNQIQNKNKNKNKTKQNNKKEH